MIVLEEVGNSKAKKKQTLEGTSDSELFYGGLKGDMIYTGGGNDFAVGGEGNDTITAGDMSSSSLAVFVGKGDGNDTININPESNYTYINLVLNKSPELSFEKSEYDLIVTAVYPPEGKGKDTTQTVTFKNFYNDYNEQLGDLKITLSTESSFENLDQYELRSILNNSPSRYLEDIMQSGVTTIKGKASKDNILYGTEFDDVIYCGNKTDMIYEHDGDNVIYTGKKGATAISSTSSYYSYEPLSTEGSNDTYIVSSINNKTVINDVKGNDTLQINGANPNDTHLYFDVDRYGEVMDTPYIQNGEIVGSQKYLYFMSGKGLTEAINKNTVATPIEATTGLRPSDAHLDLRVTGVGIADYFKSEIVDVSDMSDSEKEYYGIDPEDDEVTIYNNKIENIVLADKNGKNGQTISGERLDFATLALSSNLRRYLNNYGAMSYNSTQQLITTANDYLADKTTNKVTKKIAKQELQNLTNVYKTIQLGTDKDEVYSNIKAQEIVLLDSYGNKSDTVQMDTGILSGKGSDTFKFAKNFGRVTILAESDGIGGTFRETDTLVLKNYSFENGTLDIRMTPSGMIAPISPGATIGGMPITIAAWDKGLSAEEDMPSGMITYSGFYSTYAPAQNKGLIIQDKSRTYEASFVASPYMTGPHFIGDSYTIPTADYSGSNKNNLVAVYGDANIISGKGYNIIQNIDYDSSSYNHSITYTGGHDRYIMEGSEDNYIVNFDKNISLTIQDDGEYDMLNLVGKVSGARLFFGVELYDGNAYTGDDLKILDRSIFTAANVQKSGLNTVGIDIIDYFYDYGKIENIVYSNNASGNIKGSVDMSSWINSIKSNVAGWLSDNGFTSTQEVFETGSKANINELIAVYKGEEMPVMYI